jgi:hypothetical protein
MLWFAVDWRCSVDVNENEGRRPEWTTANPRNPQANYGIGDRDGHMSMQISQFKGCTVMSTR